MLAGYSFRPRLWALALAACAAGIALGNWQSRRADEKRALAAEQQNKHVSLRGVFRPELTVLLGLTFIFVQGYEYFHAYHELNLKLTSGAYGSTFFMLTGFHGFHVFVGMLMLLFITLRLMKGHFTPERHFGFEGAAWYWHFVDVVWLGLYTLVYWL